MVIDPIKKFFSANPDCVFLHASSISISGKALLFLGHSNAGKSTISGILSRQFHKIADDKVLIYRKKNWMVRGVKGDRFLRENSGDDIDSTEYPVIAVARIFQDKETRFISISQKEACRHIMDAVFENDFQNNYEDLSQIKKWFKIAANLSHNTKGYRLTFPKCESIIEKVSEFIGNEMRQKT